MMGPDIGGDVACRNRRGGGVFLPAMKDGAAWSSRYAASRFSRLHSRIRIRRATLSREIQR